MLPVITQLLDTSNGDHIFQGSAVATAAGLLLMPIEPVTGITLLTVGLGIGGAKVKGTVDRANIKAIENAKKLSDAVTTIHEDEVIAQHLQEENSRLRYALLAGLIVSVAAYSYNTYNNKKEKDLET